MLPTKATFSGGTIEWIYSASGAKLAKIITVGTGTPTQRDYVNGFEYLTNGETILNRLEHFTMDEGRMRPTTPGGTTYRYEFDLKDHLGNTRMTLTDANNNGLFDNYAAEVLQADDYYPFGMRITRKLSALDNKYTYNGKEHENEFGLNWYHYGARYYDPAIGRWWAVDPADQYNTPYGYVSNDPIMKIDKDGRVGEGAPISYNSLFYNAMKSIWVGVFGEDKAFNSTAMASVGQQSSRIGFGVAGLAGAGSLLCYGGTIAQPELAPVLLPLGSSLGGLSAAGGTIGAAGILTDKYYSGALFSNEDYTNLGSTAMGMGLMAFSPQLSSLSTNLDDVVQYEFVSGLTSSLGGTEWQKVFGGQLPVQPQSSLDLIQGVGFSPFIPAVQDETR